MDRSRAYSKKIESGEVKVPQPMSCLLNDIPAPEKTLAADPIALEDEGLVRIFKSTFVNYNSSDYFTLAFFDF